MKKNGRVRYYPLANLDAAIRKKIEYNFPRTLYLLGSAPNDWPDFEAPELAEKAKEIKAGIIFQFMQDFIWPDGRDQPSTRPIFAGRFPPTLMELNGQGANPSLSEVLWSPNKLQLQPVALRSFEDAQQYASLGRSLKNEFPHVTTTAGRELQHFYNSWSVRHVSPLNAKVSQMFRQKMGGSLLYYAGAYPGTIADKLLPEIKYRLGTGRDASDLSRYGLYAPPDRKFEHSFRRQVALLAREWEEVKEPKSTLPSFRWVLESLANWQPGEPDLQREINDDFAKSYRRELISLLCKKKKTERKTEKCD